MRKRRKIPTTAKTRRYILELRALCFGRVSIWGMKQLFPKHLAKKYLKAKKLSRLEVRKERVRNE